jgi:cobalt-zinc-cadmium efflux system membrane fusion protein
VWALGDVFEKDLVGLKSGTAAEVTASAYPSQKWDGRVGNIGDAVDPNTRTLKLRVVLVNAGEKLKPEMFVSIRVLRSTFDGIAVPTSAVLRESNGPYVFVQASPGHFAKREVAIGRSIGQYVEIKSGLQPGETIVVDGALLIRASGS